MPELISAIRTNSLYESARRCLAGGAAAGQGFPIGPAQVEEDFAHDEYAKSSAWLGAGLSGSA
jgi:hypothetical protein